MDARFDRERLARLGRDVEAHVVFSVRTALEAVRHNTLRAGLTSLGILFGVASVIAMLAIGKGAEQEILEQMRLLGTNNIVITPLVEQEEGKVSDDEPQREVKKFSPGLTLGDAQAIARVLPAIEATSAEVVVNTTFTREGRRRTGKVVGVDTAYFRVTNLTLRRGSWFRPLEVERGLPVAVIGQGVRTRFFTTEDPIGKPLKVGDTWLTVVGVLEDRRLVSGAERLGIRDVNMDVYVPARTMLLRYRNRALVTQRDVELASRSVTVTRSDEEPESDERRAERTHALWPRARGVEHGLDGAARLLREQPHHAHRRLLAEDREQDGLVVDGGDVDALARPLVEEHRELRLAEQARDRAGRAEGPRGQRPDRHGVERRRLPARPRPRVHGPQPREPACRPDRSATVPRLERRVGRQ